LTLLGEISEKDLRDTPASTLSDHLNNTPPIPAGLYQNNSSPSEESGLFRSYVLNPRIANEFLTPYKHFFAGQTDAALVDAARENPQALVDWVKQHITLHDELNPQRIPIMPAGVWKARIADSRSRSIFFVALARSMGVPARIERVAGKVQYYNREWVDVDFEASQATVAKQGFVTAAYTPTQVVDNPKYYTHFSIAKIRPDAQLQTLNFERKGATADMEQGDSWAGLLKAPLALDEGAYLLVSGARIANGKVLARIASFTVRADRPVQTRLVMRENAEEIQVIGNLDAEATFLPAGSDKETSLLGVAGRGYFIIGLLGVKQEPTNHALRDIAQLKDDFEKWNRSIILLFKNEQERLQFQPTEWGELPATITYGTDNEQRIATMLADGLKLPDANTLPIFVIADSFGRIVFVSKGYTIGLGEQMMKVIHKL
jgi:hypothetical protein